MIKVFLVEDEFIVREGIKKNINWSGNGFEFCGEAGDGEMAYPMIQNAKPDIVITDIMMPFMDGLALSRLIKSKLPETEIIVLSGYSEFEYAKEAIKIGVAQYISKPVNSEELLAEVKALSKKIEEKRLEKEISEKYKREMEENTNAQRKLLFNYLVTGSLSTQVLYEKAEHIGIDLSSVWYNIVLFGLQGIAGEQAKSMEQAEKLLATLSERISSEQVIVFDRNLDGIAILLKGDSEQILAELQQKVISTIENSMKEEETTGYFGGVGMPVSRMSELPKCFDKAAHAFAHRYFEKDSAIRDYRNMEGKSNPEPEDFDIFNIDTKQIDRSKITSFLKQGEMGETGFFVDEFVYGVGSKALASSLFRQYLVMDVYFCIVEFLESFGADKNVIDQPDVSALAGGSADGVRKYIAKIIETTIRVRDNSSSNRYRAVVDEVKNYICERYMDEELSLNEIAKVVNFSPNHLSTVFAQETGQTFIKYLTEFRINKSMELLKCTGHRSSEISCMVGYKDPHYFSFLFKKMVGVTPTQYRDGKTEN